MRWMPLAAVLLSAAIIEGAPAEAASSAARAPTAIAAAKHPRPLCRRNFVPVKRGRRHRCVAVPKVTSDEAMLRTLIVRRAPWPASQRPSRTEAATLRAMDKELLHAMHDALARLRLLHPGTAARSVTSVRAATQAPGPRARAAGAKASFDTGQLALENGMQYRESGSVSYPPNGQSGVTEENTAIIDFRGSTDLYRSSMSVKLASCPDASGQVKGTVSARLEMVSKTLELGGFHLDSTNTQVNASVTARVSDGARVQPYDLKGTIVFVKKRSWYRPHGGGQPTQRTTRKLGFVEIGIPLDRAAGRAWTSNTFDDPFEATFADLVLERLYPRIGRQLHSIEAAWREQKRCVKVIPAPASIKLAQGKTQQVVVTARRAAAGGRDIAVPIDASTSTGTITPRRAGTKLGAPARFTFKMTSSRSGVITFSTTSRYGIGEARVPVSPPLAKRMMATLTSDATYQDPFHSSTLHATIHVTFVRNDSYDAAKPDSFMWVPESGTWTQDDTSVNKFDTCPAPDEAISPTAVGHGSGSHFRGAMRSGSSGGLDYVEGKRLRIDVAGTEPIQEHYTCPSGFQYTVPTGAGASFILQAPDLQPAHVALTGTYTDTSDTGTSRLTWNIVPAR